MKKFLVMACLTGSALTFAFFGAAEDNTAASISALFGDPVVARGRGFEITRSQVDQAFVAIRASMAAQGRALPESDRALREAALLDDMIAARLLTARATAEDKSIASTNAARFIAEKRRAAPSEGIFQSNIKAMGLSMERYEARIMEKATVDVVLTREVKSKIAISAAQVEDFYKTGADLEAKAMEAALSRMSNNPNTRIGDLQMIQRDIDKLRNYNLGQLQEPDRVRASHVLVSVMPAEGAAPLTDAQRKARRLDIERLAARIKGGEDFAKLAREVSQDPRAKETGGEYTFIKEEPSLPPEFTAAAFSLATNQVSDIVITRAGFHLIKLHEKIPGKKLPFDQAAGRIREVLAGQEMDQRLPDYFEALKKDAAVEILDPRYKLPPRPADRFRPPI